MNIEAKKLSFIQEFLRIDNENIINALESLLHRSKSEVFEESLKPKTVEQLNDEIDEAIEDEKNGRTITAEELKRKVQEWH